MRISAKGRYALASVVHMAQQQHSGESITLVSISERLGISKIYLEQVFSLLKRGELVTVLDEFAVPSYDIQAVYPQQRYLPAKVRHFIDYLKAIYNREGYWEG